ncbi:MAG: TOBE domain-containing protein, partial [Casimicrobiaceae bacterium]
EQNGAPVDLYEEPVNTFVARFIGTPPMNLLRLERGALGAVIAGTAAPVVADGGLAGATLGVRPEHVELCRADGVAASIDAVEYLGADSLLACRAGDQPLTVRVGGRVGLRRGDAVRLGWAPGAAHFFDGATQMRREVESSHRAATMVA